MKLDLKRSIQNHHAVKHLIFWAFSLFFLMVANHFQTASLGCLPALVIALFTLPVHLLYGYVLVYQIIPKYLEKKQNANMLLAMVALVILISFLYRLDEIFIIEPYIFNTAITQGASAHLIKLDQSLAQQLTDPKHLMNAFEKTNLIVWFAVAVRFFKLWHQRKQLALQTELNFLKAQIHPHFLFNTLNNLYALTLTKSQKAPAIVLGLSEILRYMLHECNTENVSLTRDIAILKNYITLEKIRYGDRLNLNLNITGNVDHLYIPPLLMLPLVENAFKHGASEMLKGAWITIDICVTAPNKLTFKVANSKPLQKNKNAELHFEKIGLKNVRKRLDFLYKDAYQLNIYTENELFVAILEIDLSGKCTKATNEEKDEFKGLKKSGWAAI